MTGLDLDVRFDKHKAGAREIELATGLREAGYRVWQA